MYPRRTLSFFSVLSVTPRWSWVGGFDHLIALSVSRHVCLSVLSFLIYNVTKALTNLDVDDRSQLFLSQSILNLYKLIQIMYIFGTNLCYITKKCIRKTIFSPVVFECFFIKNIFLLTNLFLAGRELLNNIRTRLLLLSVKNPGLAKSKCQTPLRISEVTCKVR